MGKESTARKIVDPRALPELTDAYHNARHILAFLSGLLLTWDYLGLGFEGAQEGLFGLKVSIIHANFIPNAILILGFYAALRLGVEWWQCDSARRDTTASMVDCAAAYLLFVAAESVYVLNRIHPEFSLLTTVGAVVGVLVTPLFVVLFKLPQPQYKWADGLRRPTTRLFWTILSSSGVAALTVTALGLLLGLPSSMSLGLPIGAALCGIAVAPFYKAIARRLSSRLPANA